MALPEPEPGLVISYVYLWHHEHQSGHDEGRKDRPCVIVVAAERTSDGATVVTVAPDYICGKCRRPTDLSMVFCRRAFSTRCGLASSRGD
jgi:hypothetical protein